MHPVYISRRVLMSKVSGGRVRGRPRLGWMDCAVLNSAPERKRWILRDNAR